jgi:hydrogenase maturation protein HypF
MFLTHNRPIVRPIDDSVVREGPGNIIHVLRRARGFAPLPVTSIDDPRSILAFGAFLKSTLSLTSGGALITSQHLGDMDDVRSIDLLERTAREMCAFYDIRPALLACDLHPDFPSTRLAERLASEWRVPLVRVQHHHAHIAAVMAEHGLSGEVLGLAWDGYGFGSDTRAWGGESLVVNENGFRRVASFSPFPLPGGDRATREPRRCGLGLLAATLGPDETLVYARGLFDETKTKALLASIHNKNVSPETSSVGRLFDAVASLIGLPQQTSFEGQAAMALEFCAETFLSGDVEPYPIPLANDTLAIAHLGPLVRALLADRAAGASVAFMAARFQESLVDLALRIALRVGLPSVALSGGCFQNAFLARATAERLAKAGFSCFMPRAVPSNDGGISVGQILVASRASIGQGVN